MIFLLGLLTKIPFLGTAIGFVSSKKRLIIEYALIAVVLSLAAVTFTLWLQKRTTDQKLETVQASLTTLEVANQIQDKTIDDLKDLRKRDAHALDGLLSDFKVLAEHDNTVRRKLRNLETTNEAVRDYLNKPVPAELACVLDNTCNKDSDQDGKGSAPGQSPSAVPSPAK